MGAISTLITHYFTRKFYFPREGVEILDGGSHMGRELKSYK